MGIEFGKNLQATRRAKGLTQKGLAEVLQVNQSAVAGWESGRFYPSASTIPLIEKLLEISIANLIALDSAPDEPDPQPPTPANIELPPELERVSMKGIKMIPVIGMASAAHYDPSFSQLSDLFQGVDEFIPCFLDNCDGAFALRISGDSMVPVLHDGDVVTCCDRLPETGKLCVVMHKTDGILCKRWYWRRGIIRLESINEEEGKTYEWTKESYRADNPLIWRFRVEALFRKDI